MNKELFIHSWWRFKLSLYREICPKLGIFAISFSWHRPHFIWFKIYIYKLELIIRYTFKYERLK